MFRRNVHILMMLHDILIERLQSWSAISRIAPIPIAFTYNCCNFRVEWKPQQTQPPQSRCRDKKRRRLLRNSTKINTLFQPTTIRPTVTTIATAQQYNRRGGGNQSSLVFWVQMQQRRLRNRPKCFLFCNEVNNLLSLLLCYFSIISEMKICLLTDVFVRPPKLHVGSKGKVNTNISTRNSMKQLHRLQ